MQRLYVIGIGPGGNDCLTIQAKDALEECQAVVGYTEYVKLIEGICTGKEVLSTGMMKEIERCRAALQLAQDGKTTAIVCSGDAGVYGMASPILELSPEFPDVDIVVLPGVSAAQSGSAVLGAPISHDFAVISLSDLLTPWNLIERRLRAAAQADFCVVIYNPQSKKRKDHLHNAAKIMLEHKDPATVCGWVRMIGREGQEHGFCTLEELQTRDVDMFTTVFVGNAQTRLIDGRMVTPRGYGAKA